MGSIDGTIRLGAFMASTGAAALHIAAIASHRDWPPAAAFMAVAGIAQLAWGLAIIVGSSRTARAGLVLHGSIIGVWLVSRTIGLPVGPHAWTPEHVHEADALASGLAALAIVSCVALLRGVTLRPIARVCVVAASLTVLVEGHDPTRERLTALGLLVLAEVLRRFLLVRPWLGRSYEVANVRPVVPGVLVAARAGIGAGG